ncbi:hypothetical protein [Clostridium algidicarnis]|uniref:hypothetical protein n=1 Tax=Clostridium algidicarnis TaxID=37659 RepID=UPI0018DBC604|nr:hypothetical protein [Clostridium algidicarnis]
MFCFFRTIIPEIIRSIDIAIKASNPITLPVLTSSFLLVLDWDSISLFNLSSFIIVLSASFISFFASLSPLKSVSSVFSTTASSSFPIRVIDS